MNKRHSNTPWAGSLRSTMVRKLRCLITLVLLLPVVLHGAQWAKAGSLDIELEVASFYIFQFDFNDVLYVNLGAELRNVGTSIVKDITCSFDLYSGTQLLATETALVYIDHLGPDETTPLFASFGFVIDLPWTRVDRVVWHPTGVATTEEPWAPAISLLYSDEQQSDGYFYLTAEVQNTGVENILLEYVVASFYDSAGSIVEVSHSQADRLPGWIVEPGATFPFCRWYPEDEPGQTASWKLQVSAQPTTALPLTLDISNITTWNDRYGVVHVSGDLHNPHDVATGWVTVLVLSRDEHGNLVNYAFGSISSIGPGQIAPFDVSRWCQTQMAQHFEVRAQCETTRLGPTPTASPTSTATRTATLTPTATTTRTHTPTSTAARTATLTAAPTAVWRVLLPIVLKEW